MALLRRLPAGVAHVAGRRVGHITLVQPQNHGRTYIPPHDPVADRTHGVAETLHLPADQHRDVRDTARPRHRHAAADAPRTVADGRAVDAVVAEPGAVYRSVVGQDTVHSVVEHTDPARRRP